MRLDRRLGRRLGRRLDRYASEFRDGRGGLRVDSLRPAVLRYSLLCRCARLRCLPIEALGKLG